MKTSSRWGAVLVALHLVACGSDTADPIEAAEELVAAKPASPLSETGCLFVRAGDEVRFYMGQPGIVDEIGNMDADAPLSTPARQGWGWTRFTIPTAMLPTSGTVVFDMERDPGLTFWHQPSQSESTSKHRSTEEGIVGWISVTADQGEYLIAFKVRYSCGQNCLAGFSFGPSAVPFSEVRPVN